MSMELHLHLIAAKCPPELASEISMQFDSLQSQLAAANAELAKARTDSDRMRKCFEDAREQWMQCREELKSLHEQQPVAWMNGDRAKTNEQLADIAGYDLLAKNGWTPLYSAPVPAQPAVPEVSAEDAIPAGWVFYSADASIQSSDPRRPISVMIKRDVAGVHWWLQLTEEEKGRTPLYSSGAGMTLTLAIQNAVAAILSATKEVRNGP